MPRKARQIREAEAGGSASERFDRFLDEYRFPDPAKGVWLIDQFSAGADHDVVRRVREQACDAALSAFGRAFAHRQADAQYLPDRNEARDVEALAAAVRAYLNAGVDEDGNAGGRVDLVEPDGDESQMPSATGLAVRRTASELLGRLSEHATALRRTPRGSSRKRLQYEFAEAVTRLWPTLWPAARSEKEKQAFAFALWQDMNFPLDDDMIVNANGVEWMRSVFRQAQAAP